jgi:hypothetical protein
MLALVVDRDFHEQRRWVVFQTYHLLEALRKKLNGVFISSQGEYDEHKEEISSVYACFPGWGAPKIRYDNSIPHTKGIILSDPHGKAQKDWLADYVQDEEFDYLFGYYYYPSLYHFPHFRNKLLHFPWAIPDHYLIPEPKLHNNNFITIHGAVSHDAYECRRWCREFPFVRANNNSGCENSVFSEAEYFKWLEQFDAVIAAGSTANEYQLVTPKYFEIMSSGALLFAQNCKDLEMLGFNEKSCVPFTKKDFKIKAEKYLSNPELYLEIRKEGQNIIKNRHLISHRVRDFSKALFVNKKPCTISINGQSVLTLLSEDEVVSNTSVIIAAKALYYRLLKEDIKGANIIDVYGEKEILSPLLSLQAEKMIVFEPDIVCNTLMRRIQKMNPYLNITIVQKAIGLLNGLVCNRFAENASPLSTFQIEACKLTEVVETTSVYEIVKDRIDLVRFDLNDQSVKNSLNIVAGQFNNKLPNFCGFFNFLDIHNGIFNIIENALSDLSIDVLLDDNSWITLNEYIKSDDNNAIAYLALRN